MIIFLLSTLVMAPSVPAAAAPAPSSDKTASSGGSASQEELAQMFMAATYPLEIVEAARFSKEKPGLKGDALDKALKKKSGM